MLRVIWTCCAVITLALCNASHASDPAVVGNLVGVELAQQTNLHPAVFLGLYGGAVDGKFALGVWATGVHHETPLPAQAGESVAITDGQWQLQVWVFQGFRLKRVTIGGDLKGSLAFSQTDQFSIDAILNATSGGSGNIVLTGTLDHTVFPPVVSADLSQ